MKNRRSYPRTKVLCEDLSFTAALYTTALAGMFALLKLWALVLT